MSPPRILIAACLILFGTATRVLPYVLHRLGVADAFDPESMPWNVSPLGAIALFGGAYLADRRTAFAVALATLFLGDLGITILMRQGAMGFNAMTPVLYASFALMVWLGSSLRGWMQRQSHMLSRLVTAGGTALVAEIAFFVITNFANWALQEYIDPTAPPQFPYTAVGLVANYVAALPFFKHSLAGMAAFGSVFFAGYELLGSRVTAAQTTTLAEAH